MSGEQSWGIPIALYLFVGGMSAAAYYVGVLADLIGKGHYRDIARIGSYAVAIPIFVGLFMLLLDLGQPLRFWHLLFQSGPLNRGLIFLPGSVMSLGTWFLVAFSLLCGVIYPLMWFSEERVGKRLPLIPLLSGKDGARRLIGALGLPFALLVAVYTGVLLAATSRPVWADTPLLPPLFVLSATSTGIAAIVFLMSLSSRSDHGILALLEKGDSFVIKVELVFVALLLVALLFSPGAVGSIKDLMFGSYSIFFWLGFIFVGLVLPLNLQRYINDKNRLALLSSALVLFGGFYLRYIILLAA